MTDTSQRPPLPDHLSVDPKSPHYVAAVCEHDIGIRLNDNAMAESFFASLECELLDRRSFETKSQARLALFSYIEGWYNSRRRHSALGRMSPANFERNQAILTGPSEALQPA